MSASISVLVDSPLQTLAHALRDAPRELRKQISTHTRKEAQPIWKSELAERGMTRIESLVLVTPARVGVTDRNVFLRTGTVGRLSSGTPVKDLSSAAEFGMGPNKQIKTRSRRGTSYTRRAGNAFRRPNGKGYVAYPAAKDSIPRFASLWVQTAIRTIHEAIEEVAT